RPEPELSQVSSFLPNQCDSVHVSLVSEPAVRQLALRRRPFARELSSLPLGERTAIWILHFRVSKPRRELYRLDHAPVVRNSAASDVESRSMIHRSANYWKAQSYIHRLTESKTLHCDKPLVVIAGYYSVEFAARSSQKQRIRWKRPGHANAAGSALVYSWLNLSRLLHAKEAVLRGVRVEPGDRDTRPGQS